MRRIGLLLALAIIGGCGSNGEAAKDTLPQPETVLPGDADDDTAEIDARSPDAPAPDLAPADILEPDEVTPVVCDKPGYAWSEGTPIFVEKTEEWGLKDVRAVRFSVLDFNHDGWPDLAARIGSGDDFSEGGNRVFWLLENDGGKGFKDVTQASGLFQMRYGTDPNKGRPGDVLAAGDVDNDGDLDIATAVAKHQLADKQETSELMLNNGEGTFSLGPKENAFREEGQYSVPAGVTFVDFDRDGLLDIWMPHNMVGGTYQPLQDRLFKGTGNALHKEVTYKYGLKTEPWLLPPVAQNEGRGHSWAWSSAACDFNNDGSPDLLAASYGRAPNHLWQGGNADNFWVFTNRSVASGYAYDHRMDWSDNESARCFCKLHPDAEDCDGVPPPQYTKCDTDADIFRWDHDMDREPWRLGGNSAQSTCEDVNNDGFLDIFTGEIVHWDVGSSSDPAELMLNAGEGDIRFERPGPEVTGIIREHEFIDWNDGDMTNQVFDFDNDGWMDVYLGDSDYPYCRGRLYHQASPEKFEEVELDDFFEHLRSHGVAAADFDRDGDLDLVVGHSLMRCGGQYLDDCYEEPIARFFENKIGSKGNWLQVRLEGTGGSNRSAIGAQVRVTTGEFTTVREVDGGYGHFNTQKDMVLHFGLGASCVADVEVRWPDVDLTTQVFELAGNKRYTVKQGEVPKEWEL
ncbi:MAG: CRTAC1 family protein [Deltaproteobacteria bacterium]|nr:CRTAC1 family protein [Deltaproteobacteria bacterium]